MAFGLQIDLAGGTYYLTDGEAVGGYAPTLAPVAFRETLSLFGATPALQSVTLEMYRIPFARLVAKGHRVSGVEGRLYDLDDDGTETLLFTGSLDEPTYGALDEPSFASLREGAYADANVMPKINEVVTADNFASATGAFDSLREGNYYPLVFGEPGDALTPQRATPALIAVVGSTSYIYHRVIVSAGSVDADNIYLYNDTTGASGSFNVFTTVDDSGNTYSFAQITPIGWITAGDEIWASWTESAGRSTIYGALTALLRRSSLSVDFPSLERLKAASGWRIDAYVNTPLAPWDWIRQTLGPYLPLSPLSGAGGLSFVLHDFDGEPVETLIVDDYQVSRASQVDVGSDSDVVNSYVVNYAPAYSGGYRSTRNLKDARSVRLYGERPKVINLDFTHDADTAYRVARFLLRRNARPTIEVEYEIPVRYNAPLGALVAVTDSDLGWVAKKGWVISRAINRDRARVRVWLFR